MSWRSLLENKLKGARAAGVGIDLKGRAMELSYVLLEKKSSKLNVSSSGRAAVLAELKIPPGTPLRISINGKGIIHKRIAYTEDLGIPALLQKMLPNAKIEEFYVQHTQPVNGHVMVSVARKDSIDELLQEFKKNKLEVTSCTFGPFCISSILPLMKFSAALAEEIYLPGHTITIVDRQIDNYSSSENIDPSPIEMAGENLEPSLVIPFAAAAGHFIGSDLSISIEHTSAQAEEYRQKKIFQLAGAGLLALLFAVLLTNYFVFDHYWKKKRSYEAQYSGNQDALQKYSKLQAEYDEKMTFLQSSGLLEASRASFYADRIAIDIPASIQLTEMNICPLMKQASEQDALHFRAKEIQVQGNCRQSNQLNEWIKTIKKKDWVSEVELLNYKQGKGDAVGTFIIGMKTN